MCSDHFTDGQGPEFLAQKSAIIVPQTVTKFIDKKSSKSNIEGPYNLTETGAHPTSIDLTKSSFFKNKLTA